MCIDNCAECESEEDDGCTKCDDNYMLDDGACTDSADACTACLDGEFLDDDTCKECSSGSTDNDWNCGTCEEAAEFDEDGETDSPCSDCAAGYYMSSTDGEGCLACPYNCDSCSADSCEHANCAQNDANDDGF